LPSSGWVQTGVVAEPKCLRGAVRLFGGLAPQARTGRTLSPFVETGFNRDIVHRATC